MKVMMKINNIFDRIMNALTFFAGILLYVVVGLIFAGIVFRSLGYPIAWGNEVSEYIMLYIAFLIIAWVLREGGHVRIDIVISHIRPRIQLLINMITSVICIIISFILTWYGTVVTYKFYITGQFAVSLLEPPKYILLIIIPIGSALLFIQSLRMTYSLLGNWRTKSDKKPIHIEHEI